MDQIRVEPLYACNYRLCIAFLKSKRVAGRVGKILLQIIILYLHFPALKDIRFDTDNSSTKATASSEVA